MKALVKFNTNWADEMDIAGFHIMSEKVWDHFHDLLTHKDFPSEIEIGFGTNEYDEYTKERILKMFDVTLISDEYAEQLKSNFSLPFGHFPTEQIAESAIYIMEEDVGADMENYIGDDAQWFWDEIC